jgi:hypothetical protein
MFLLDAVTDCDRMDLRRCSVQLRKVGIEHHLPAANEQDGTLNSRIAHNQGIWHIPLHLHATLRPSRKQKTARASPAPSGLSHLFVCPLEPSFHPQHRKKSGLKIPSWRRRCQRKERLGAVAGHWSKAYGHAYAAPSSSTLNPISLRPFSSGRIICRMASKRVWMASLLHHPLFKVANCDLITKPPAPHRHRAVLL